VFTDIVGSTKLRARLGEAATTTLLRAHIRHLEDAVRGRGGQVIKGLGDGIMATFGAAADAVAASVAIQQAVARQNRSAAEAVHIRVGLSAGDVTIEANDVQGLPVVEAARLCAEAEGDEILASEVVRLLAGSPEAFRPVGLRELKGLPQPLMVWQVAWESAGTSAIPLPPLLTTMGQIFVGRDSELDQLGEIWLTATGGQRRMALLAGEAGIGKTRLASELAGRVHQDGAVVLAGRCDEDLGVPYQPFVEALRHFCDHTPPGELAARLGRHATELVRLNPDLAPLVADLPPPLQSDPETERYRLFEAVAGWLAAAATEQPVLLVLDDLQWATKPTLLLLRHVMRATDPMSLCFVGTYRDTDIRRGDPLADLLVDLWRLPGVERLVLGGLDRQAVAAFLSQMAGHDLGTDTGALADAMWEETDGNPFFVSEVVRNLYESGNLQQRGGRWTVTAPIDELGIPEGVRAVVGRRLSRLSNVANGVLACAAVAGLSFRPAVVQAASGVSEEAVVAALEEAVATRLVVELPDEGFRFSHALVRTTLYDELSAARRGVLHRKVAEALEALGEDAREDALPALAHHWLRAVAPSSRVDRAVDYATRAGDRALRQLAHDEAVSYYSQALDLLDADATADDPRRLTLLIDLGEAQRRAGDPAHRQTLLDAAAFAQRLGDADGLARAALANNRGFFSVSDGVDEERVGVLERALAALDPADSPVRARLLANLAEELGFSPEHDRRERLAAEALEMALRLGDASALAQVLSRRYSTLPTTAERRRELAALTDIADRLGDPAVQFWGHVYGCLTDLTVGDAEGYRRSLDACGAIAAELGQPTLRWTAGFLQSAASRLEGRLDEAEAASREALDIGTGAGIRDAFYIHAVNLFWIRYDQGRLDEVIGVYERAADRPGAESTTLANLALSQVELGVLDEAGRTFGRLTTDAFARLPRNFAWVYELTILAEVCTGLGDAAQAAVLWELLVPYRGLVATVGGGTTGAVDRFLGLLAGLRGDLDEAESCFKAAVEVSERLGAAGSLARIRLEWAEVLLARGGAEREPEARRLLDQAVTAAGKLGLTTVERRALALTEPGRTRP
jgi:tetratricopeptide (TPR) repeat protein